MPITFQSEDQQSAVANLAMLREMAAGRTKKAKPEDIETRFNLVLSFLMTGNCVADDETRKIVQQFGSGLKQIAQAQAA